ncbi:MAG TPA: integrase arm-type DNA-binding domain-containing protein [Acetobacteraceae bacterium]|nr:integrase arm-type DNA-binding domain-containing protein [Acetobacteraceae bacterium]
MARREIGKLTPAKVKSASKPGLYGDGGGLWLNVGPTGGKSWLFRFMLNGRAREMGLGPLHTIGLAEARERARAARHQLLDGIDPLDARKAEKQRKAAEAAARVTFREVAEKYVKAHRASWRNEKHAWQWGATLEAHVYPTIGDVAVGAVDTGHVTRILEPIWTTKAETAARVRGRIESILDYAKTHGWRTGENPARWKGHLQNVLPARAKVSKVEHHAALPWREIGAFIAELAKQDGTARLALQFAILTAARTGEVIGARWGEIDMAPPRRVTIGRDDQGQPIIETTGAVWTIPAGRTKAGKPHRVPLAGPALDVLREAAKLRHGESPNDHVFPGGKGGKSSRALSNIAMLMLLRRMDRDDLTVHGFRSTFRDWCAEATGYPRELAEAALAHALDSKVEAAYQRGDLLEKRRRLMNEWAAFCGRTEPVEGDNVTALHRHAEVA